MILQQPVHVSAEIGDDFSFSVIAYSSDGGTLSYQWYFKSANSEEYDEAVAIENATTATYSEKVTIAILGSYYCVVTNSISDNGDGGAKSAHATTNTALLSNNVLNANAPVITAQPSDVTAIVPASRTFTVGAYVQDGGTLSYQWYSVSSEDDEGTAVEGATEPTYTVRAEEAGKTGFYCVVTNTIEDNGDGGTKTARAQSKTAWFEAVYLKDAVPAPSFTKQPASMNIAPYGQSVRLSCKAEAASGYNVVYRWYESTDGTTATGKPLSESWSSSADLETDVFNEKGKIRYFYCVATAFVPSEDEDVDSKATISDVVSVACTGLPTLYLDTNVSTYAITRDSYVQGSMKLISEEYDDFSYIFTKAKEGVKGRGNSSWGMPKKGYNIKFDSKQSVFGLPEAKKWCIIANYSDKSLLRNKFASVLGTELYNAEWNPSFVLVDVVMNGEYLGNYTLAEKITITDGRIEVQDISDCTEKKIANGKYTDQNGDGEVNLYDGGFILEIDARLDAEFSFYTTKGVPVTLKDPDEVSEEIKNHIKTLVQTAEDVLYDDDFDKTLTDDDGNAILTENGEEQSVWMQYLDTDSFVDWYIVNEFAKNVDAPFLLSVYMYYNPTDKKLHLGPNWDFDIGFGNADYTNDANTTICSDPTGWYIKIAKVGTSENWISRLFKDPRFVAKVKSRWNEKKSDLHTAIATSTGTIQSLANDIIASAEYNFINWQILGVYVWPNAAGYEERTTYQSEVDYLIDWCNARYDWLDSTIGGL